MHRRLFLVFTLASALGCKREAPAPSSPPPEVEKEALPNVPQPAVPPVSHWALDPENSSVSFVSKHVFTNVRGMFQQPAGTVTLDDAHPENSKIEATIAISSITTGVAERDSHLSSPDFFDAAKWPVATFGSTGVRRANPTEYTVVGNLTLHGVTKPVTLAVTAPPPFDHAGGIRRGIEATTTLNRRDFGLVWDFPGEGTGVVVGDTIKITVDAELVLQQPGTP